MILYIFPQINGKRASLFFISFAIIIDGSRQYCILFFARHPDP